MCPRTCNFCHNDGKISHNVRSETEVLFLCLKMIINPRKEKEDTYFNTCSLKYSFFKTVEIGIIDISVQLLVKIICRRFTFNQISSDTNLEKCQ